MPFTHDDSDGWQMYESGYYVWNKKLWIVRPRTNVWVVMSYGDEVERARTLTKAKVKAEKYKTKESPYRL